MKNEIKTLSVKVADKIVMPRSRMRGLGDVVAAIANPIAKAADAVLKTNITGCGACGKRQDKLNKLMPFDTTTK
jgi:lauroyl/myristoyl acyltransferase